MGSSASQALIANPQNVPELLRHGDMSFVALPELFAYLESLPKEVRGEVFQDKVDLLATVHGKIDEISESFSHFRERNEEMVPYMAADSESWNIVKIAAQRAANARRQKQEAQKVVFASWGEAAVRRDFEHVLGQGDTAWSRLRALCRKYPDYEMAKGLIRYAIF